MAAAPGAGNGAAFDRRGRAPDTAVAAAVAQPDENRAPAAGARILRSIDSHETLLLSHRAH